MVTLRVFAFSACLVAMPPVVAAPIIYSGFDSGSTSLSTSPNATGQASAFDAAVSTAEIDTFASPVNPDVTRTYGAHTAIESCNNTYAYNTTPGGGHFICDNLGYGVIFTFKNSINAFGLYLTSYQGTENQVVIRYEGGSRDYVSLADVGNAERGTYFYGFEDSQALIKSISFEPGPERTSFGYDDLRYRFAPESTDPGDPVRVSEPSSLVLLAISLFALGASRLRRS